MAKAAEIREADVVDLGQNAYWIDFNGNGRQTEDEKIQVKNGENRTRAVQAFLTEKSDKPFGCESKWKIKFVTPSQYFDHPKKTAFRTQLQQDVARLQGMKDKGQLGSLYSGLLKDLTEILDELQVTRFRYPENGEQIPDGFLATYDHTTSTVTLSARDPMSLLVHEMDHALTHKRRIGDWSIAIKVRGCDGKVYDEPKDPKFPDPTPENSRFSFVLDFPQTNPPSFTYDDVAAHHQLLKLVETGQPGCTTETSRQTALANEVRAYITMCR